MVTFLFGGGGGGRDCESMYGLTYFIIPESNLMGTLQGMYYMYCCLNVTQTKRILSEPVLLMVYFIS